MILEWLKGNQCSHWADTEIRMFVRIQLPGVTFAVVCLNVWRAKQARGMCLAHSSGYWCTAGRRKLSTIFHASGSCYSWDLPVCYIWESPHRVLHGHMGTVDA